MQHNLDQVTTSMERIEIDIDLYQARLEYLRTKRDKVEGEIEQLMVSLQDVLHQKKEQLLDRLNEMYYSERQKLLNPRVKKEIETAKQTGPSRAGYFKQSNSKGAEHARSNKEEPRLRDLKLNVNLDELLSASRKLPFGDVDAMYSHVETLISSPLTSELSKEDCEGNALSVCAAQTKTIASSVREDTEPPKLSDIAVVEVRNMVALVVADRSNKCIKSFYKRGALSLYSTYSSSVPPRGIASFRQGKVGVTFPESRVIKIIQVTPVLIRENMIKTTKRYRGIAMLDLEKLVVSSYDTNSGSVDIIDNQGNVLRSLSTDRNGYNLFEAPFYLCTTPERHIIVSDCEKHMITCITENGKVIFQYGEGAEVTVGHPLGLTVDTYGDILVADCDNHKVVKILNDGQGAKDYLRKEDGISGPYSVDIDACGTLYVIEWNGNIKIFNKG